MPEKESDNVMEMWDCSICKCNFNNARYKRKHFILVHANKTGCAPKPRKFVCDVCHKAYMEKKHLKFHISLKHCTNIPDSAKKCLCHICDKEFSNRSNLNRHINASHLLISFDCTFCEKSFNYKDNLRYHILTNH